MVFKNNIVAVQFKKKYGEEYEGNKYSYYSDVPLEVGQFVKVSTKYGESKVRVCEVGISEETLPGVLRAQLKTITEDCLIFDENGNPEIDAQQAIDSFFSN